MQGRRERGLRERRDHILSATRAALVEEGADALSMRTLAKRAGVSVATLYNRFGSKEAILAALFEAELDALAGGLSSKRSVDAVARCRALLDASLNRFIRQAPFYRQLLGAIERQGSTPQRSALMRRSTELLLEAIARGVEDGQLNADAPSFLVARHIVWGYVQAIRYWASGDLTHAGFRAQTESALLLGLLTIAVGPTRADITARLTRLSPELLAISQPRSEVTS